MNTDIALLRQRKVKQPNFPLKLEPQEQHLAYDREALFCPREC